MFKKKKSLFLTQNFNHRIQQTKLILDIAKGLLKLTEFILYRCQNLF